MIDRLVGNWKFHFALRLASLVVILVSVYTILTREDAPQDFNNPVAQISISEAQAAPVSDEEANVFQVIEPAAGTDVDMPSQEKMEKQWTNPYPIEESDITVDTVLVPQKETVISSSRDGKIVSLPFHNGDRFAKGDILVRYSCDGLEAEAEIAAIQKKLTEKKNKGVSQLFKLDLISDMDRLNVEAEDRQMEAKVRMYRAQLNDCTIRADFDGIVTKKLANIGEYTRTDRVLMEVASDDALNLEFLLPSKWLRWVNVGAPVHVKVNETGHNYTGRVTRIHGAVDPVSQTIQIRATLDPYRDMLLSGMSGKVTLDASEMEKAGVKGYLAENASGLTGGH